MKKIIGIGLLFSVLVISCQKKTTPTVTTRTEQPPAPVKKEVTPAVNTSNTTSVADLEAGKLIYETKCAKCHAPKPVTNWTVESWKPILKSMVRKSKLDSTETAQVTAWVNANAKKI